MAIICSNLGDIWHLAAETSGLVCSCAAGASAVYSFVSSSCSHLGNRIPGLEQCFKGNFYRLTPAHDVKTSMTARLKECVARLLGKHADRLGCVLQFICCVLLYTFANVLATLFSKTLASHFHKATHFALMQEAFLKASSSGLESPWYP